ncbi:MAG TPA: NADPH-dependent 7-cyano-7-deazaguanine reductase QueF, partial [Thermoanaerobaculia bacterium]|nr:NADPH-dependent 7-cyano-7-deazaguanine reductase QueF [Thermoanaerobaculia bacterium]
LIAALDPRYLYVEGDFYIRGGIKTVVKVEHRK